jgi:hypothetical protein
MSHLRLRKDLEDYIERRRRPRKNPFSIFQRIKESFQRDDSHDMAIEGGKGFFYKTKKKVKRIFN